MPLLSCRELSVKSQARPFQLCLDVEKPMQGADAQTFLRIVIVNEKAKTSNCFAHLHPTHPAAIQNVSQLHLPYAFSHSNITIPC